MNRAPARRTARLRRRRPSRDGGDSSARVTRRPRRHLTCQCDRNRRDRRFPKSRGKEDDRMRNALIGLSLFGLLALASPLAVSADGGSVNVPTAADDVSQAAMVIDIGGEPTDAPLPSHLPALAPDEALDAVLASVAP